MKKENFTILINANDDLATVDGYRLESPVCGAEWFVHKSPAPAKGFRVSEIKSGMSAGGALSAKTIAAAIAEAKTRIEFYFEKVGKESFNAAIQKGRECMAAARARLSK